MGLIRGVAPDYFAWDKWRLGWISDDNVDCVSIHGNSEHILPPLPDHSDIMAVVVATTETTALVAEARVARGLDSAVYGPNVLLYTINTTVASGYGPIRVLDANASTGGVVAITAKTAD